MRKRKQARRLWLGDWHRDDASAAPQPVAAHDTDTAVITPIDGEDAQPARERPRDLRRPVAIAAAIGVVVAVALMLVSGGDDKPVAATPSQPPPAQTPQFQAPQAQPQPPQGAPPQGFGGPDLTGPEATRAAKAALSKYPGDIERVTSDGTGGGYVVHVIQPDGNEVHVLVDGKFKVQGSDASRGPRNLQPGTPQ